MLGTLATSPALDRPDLLAPAVLDALKAWPASSGGPTDEILVAPINADLADTAAFCEAYKVGPHESANCVVLAGRRDGEVHYAACVVLATTRADVNGVARRHLNLRKVSFAPMDDAVALTGMGYGGITPIGLPAGWPVLIDSAVVRAPRVVVGSGVRHSKLVLSGATLLALPGAFELPDLGRIVAT